MTKPDMNISYIDINQLKSNPDNPRTIKDHKFKQLVKSIREFPEMLELRPLVVNADFIVLGGNMRLEACRKAGLTMIPCIVVKNLTEKQQREFIIKDNLGYGEWDYEALANNWDAIELDDWGMDFPSWNNTSDSEDWEANKPEDSQFFLNVVCADESAAKELYERLSEEGYEVKIIT